MKSIFAKAVTVIAAFMLFTAATTWEGVTAVDANIKGSYCVATNSFPRNSVVDILNLENSKMVRVRVVSGLETTGLLATLSLSAAEAIGLRTNSTGRIRMTQPPDDIAFSNYRLGPIAPPAASTAVAAGTPAAAPAASTGEPAPNGAASPAAAAAPVPAAEPVPVPDSAPALVAGNVPASENSASEAGNVTPATADETVVAPVTVAAVPASNAAEASPGSSTAPAQMPDRPILVSTGEKLPEATGRPVIPPENFVSPIADSPVAAASDSTAATAPASTAGSESLSIVPPAHFSPFQAPLIDTLEKGMWYVQVAAYARVDHAEDEISRIGAAYPVAIQNAGNDTKPVFRVLLGPLNQGESGAMLQRLQSIGYKDAFIRHN